MLVPLLLASCDQHEEQKEAFTFLFENQWDNFSEFLDHPPRDFQTVLESKVRFSNHYNFSIVDSNRLFLKSNDEVVDTIEYLWNAETKKLNIDSLTLSKLFCKETEIRQFLINYYTKCRDIKRAWFWLRYPQPLEVDSVVGDFVKKWYGVIHPSDLVEVLPILEKSWLNGHVNSGLALSQLYLVGGNREESIKLLNMLAEKGSSEAMVRLGEIYETYYSELGYDPPKDANTGSSFAWYQRAALLENSFAMHQLAFIYERGINRNINIDSAFYWYRRSSNLGEAISSAALARLFFKDGLVRQNIDSAKFWMDRAMAQDPAVGYFELGKVYEKGLGVKVDIGLARQYYQKADSAGSPIAKEAIRRISKPLILRRVFVRDGLREGRDSVGNTPLSEKGTLSEIILFFLSSHRASTKSDTRE